ncbi:hypothetical protein IJI79_00415 [Candidatus Saccharibacteria bacterium]|nr:hypothetical protein [Candidatus Saccharibacteria bacterium]MBR0423958.1 hypothetical protein [Candidatus Saccharibacteria bacterium]
MKSFIKKFALLIMLVLTGIAINSVALDGNIYADEDTEANTTSESSDESNNNVATSISISPVSKILQLAPSSEYTDKFTITNNGSGPLKFEVYAAPYSYTYSDAEDAYKLGFDHESVYTQITRWITFKDTAGNYVEKPTFTAAPGENVVVEYKISTPESIPAGGQYAVLFAHTLSDSTGASGIKTEASPGLVVYGRADGDTVVASEVSDLKIEQTIKVEGADKTLINASGKVKNTGNVDFMASGVLKVTGIFGNVYYESTAASAGARISVIPDTELVVSDTWNETPFFGLFNVEWTVYANGQASETITKFVAIIPPVLIIVMILLLTIVIVWIIIVIRKRKERRSKFMV